MRRGLRVVAAGVAALGGAAAFMVTGGGPPPPVRRPPLQVELPSRAVPGPADTGPGWWQAERATRQARIDGWRAAMPEEEAWFRDHTVGRIGLPFIAFRALPELMPDLWGDYARELGMTEVPGEVLPFELSSGDGPKPVADLRGLRNLRMQVVAVSCASCHVGAVDGPDGPIALHGAPNGRVDFLAYRRRVGLTARDPRFTAESIQAILDGHPLGWAYGPGNEQQEWLDRLIFRQKGEEILAILREAIERNERRLEESLGTTTYAAAPELMHGGLPGQTDGYGVAAARLLAPEVETLPEPERAAAYRASLPPTPSFVDARSVWYQAGRGRAQWDGSVRAPLMRNLGAAFGVIGVAEHLDYATAYLGGRYTMGLPPPPFPWDLDAARVREGAEIYDRACASCHDHERLVAASEVGTDPGRALAVSPRVRELALAQLRAACADPLEPDCGAPDDDVLRAAPPGGVYQAVPLNGAWATAPYLHNGSVPTLYHLLVPAERPTVFWRGATAYDRERVGFAWDEAPGRVAFDTRRPGCANGGHDDIDAYFGGIDFGVDVASREALLAFLASL